MKCCNCEEGRCKRRGENFFCPYIPKGLGFKDENLTCRLLLRLLSNDRVIYAIPIWFHPVPMHDSKGRFRTNEVDVYGWYFQDEAGKLRGPYVTEWQAKGQQKEYYMTCLGE